MSRNSDGGGDSRIAVVASWAVVFVIVVQGTLSMLSQITDDLTGAARAVGIISGVGCAALFTLVQLRIIAARHVAPWTPWLVVLLGTIGFAVGAWLNAALAFAMFSLVLAGWRLVAAVLGYAVVLAAYIYGQDIQTINAFFYVLVVAAIGLMLHVLTRLAVTVGELSRARETVARLRVDEERHRISRDLHDILGRSLVAVSLRVQTAIRLLERDPERCGEQLDEAARLVSEGQSQLRGLTRGATVLGFQDELTSAQEIFDRLNVRCTADITPSAPVGEIVDSFGSRMLRECVTNLLKHSRPTWVEISLREESTGSILVIVNDGASDSGPSGGTGLSDLAERAGALGGSLEAAHLTDGRFRVLARMPTVPADPPSADTDSITLGARP